MQSVLITGVARGIGYELVDCAISSNYRVFGSVRSNEDAEALSTHFGDKFTPLIFDVRDVDAITTALGKLDRLDILINNAGIIGSSGNNTKDAKASKFLETFAINSIAPLQIAQAALPKLRQSSNGKIISISSQMSWMGYGKSDRIDYRASKAALNKIMQGLATDLLRENIPVCVIDPGWVKTDMGGLEADNDPDIVAKGIWRVINNLSTEASGTFYRWNGEERDF